MKVRVINGVRVIDRGCRNAPRSDIEEVAENNVKKANNVETENDSSSHRETTRRSRRRKNKQTNDSKQCLYCQRVFSSQNGLSQHIPHCKTMNSVFQDSQGEGILCKGCGRTFSTARGCNIHQGKTKCGSRSSLDANCMSPDNEPEVLACQETNHSASQHQITSSDERVLQKLGKKPPILWPKMKDDKKWNDYQRDVLSELSPFPMSMVDRINELERVMYGKGQEKFGIYERKSYPKNRRQRLCEKLKAQVRDLRAAFRKAEPDSDDQRAIAGLERGTREQLRAARRGENNRKRRWQRKRLRSKFYKDPSGVAKEIMEPKRTFKEPNATVASLNEYLAGVCADDQRNTELGQLDGLPELQCELPNFDDKDPAFQELLAVVKTRRNGSKPGLNMVPYKVYKKCPELLKKVFSMHKGVLKSRKVPLKWRITEGIFLPKVDKPNCKGFADFRVINLSNVEGKLFWSLISDRIYQHLVVKSKIIDTCVQKGSIKKMAGVVEHTSMVWAALQEARLRKKSMVEIWLDLANAYGSIPHSLIRFALKRYGIGEKWMELIMNYYDGLWTRLSTASARSEWRRLEKGIFAGCTLSVILFLAGFNIIIEFVNAKKFPTFILQNGNSLPLLRGFMGDLSVMTIGVPQGNEILERVQIAFF